MAYETLTLEREESFVVITLNRPPANAISEALMRDLDNALSAVAQDDSVRAVIVTGAGDRIFCAGADLGSAFAGGDIAHFIRFGNGVLRKIERFPKPVIAAMNGHALGGGCEIAMACHFRLLKETARMGQTESNLGIIPGYGGTQRLPRLVGAGRAMFLNLTGDFVDAETASAWGLVEKVVPVAELEDVALAIAGRIASQSPHAVGVLRELARTTRDLPLEEGLRREAEGFARCLRSEDGAEGVAAFIEKRSPTFTGR
jgi:enoyl-CoA hydratase